MLAVLCRAVLRCAALCFAVLCCAARCVVLTVLCNSPLSTTVPGKLTLQVCNEQLAVLVKVSTETLLIKFEPDCVIAGAHLLHSSHPHQGLGGSWGQVCHQERPLKPENPGDCGRANQRQSLELVQQSHWWREMPDCGHMVADRDWRHFVDATSGSLESEARLCHFALLRR